MFIEKDNFIDVQLFYKKKGRNFIVYNQISFKERRLLKLLQSWDAKKEDKDGNEVPVPINSETISSLAPEIAESILDSYDEICLLGTDDEKKS
jgi:hypothetical protein